MFAVGRLGSYISRGVYTVSGPFHPFGGAVDIIVVEQPDGSFKSSPWYVRFGKFQGVLKASEKVVSINVNGVDADFHMYLDTKGEAYFLKESVIEEGDAEPYPSSGDEADLKSDIWRNQKSKSCNFDTNRADLVSEFEARNGKILARANSPRRRVFGLAFGRRPNGFQNGEGEVAADRASSLERAEMAADLLEVRWTTNLNTRKESWNANARQVSSPKLAVASSFSGGQQSICGGTEGIEAEIPCSTNPGSYMEVFSLEETYIGGDPASDRLEVCSRLNSDTIGEDRNSQSNFPEVSKSNSSGDSVLETERGTDKVESSMSCDAEEDLIAGVVDCSGQSNESSPVAGEASIEPEHHISGVSSEPVISAPASEVDMKEDSSENIETQLVDEVGTFFNNELILENNTTVESQNSESGSMNEMRSEDLSTGTSDLKSLHPVSHDESCTDDMRRHSLSSGVDECLDDSIEERNSNAISRRNSEEEQFSFSDLDDAKVENVKQIEASSPDSGKECPPEDSLESSEDEATTAVVMNNKSCQETDKLIQNDLLIGQPSPKVKSKPSTPIRISNVHKVADDEFFPPIVESLPNMLLDANGINLHGIPQPLSRSLDSNFEPLRIVDNDVEVSSELGIEQQQEAPLQLTADSSQFPEEIRKIMSDPAVEISLCRHMLYEGMGYEAAAVAFDAGKLDMEKISYLGPDIVKNDELVVRIGGLYFPWDVALPIASAIGSQGTEQILEPKGMIAVGQADKTADEVPQRSMPNKNVSWRIWPFSFNRSNSMKSRSFDSEASAPKSPIGKVGKTEVVGSKVTKKKLRAKAPCSEQLASLNLKEGKNIVTFTFSTAMLGKQQVDCRIFLWKWNTRIVISDVDGTITKSDVLGQFMPLMGIDWSQTGVTHLFSAIKENGYQLLFLSARSISQASTTRQFLFNLKQDGKALPDGPVLISPDGLFPSLYREVIRRAPHEFKIACLEDVKVLYPPDHNPFYAGFGNRDTDEISYLKVGIPRGKIFIINPKGEVAVNRRVDTKSYTSLHALVHDMFPPAPASEQEDYNSWNFWRLPPPEL